MVLYRYGETASNAPNIQKGEHMQRPRSTRNRINRTFVRHYELVRYYHKESDTFHEAEILWYEFQERPALPGVEIEVLAKHDTRVLLSMSYEDFLDKATVITQEEI